MGTIGEFGGNWRGGDDVKGWLENLKNEKLKIENE